MVLVYPNQKIVQVHKAPANKDHLYGVLNKQAAMAAFRNLSHNELKTFMYLSLNQPEYEMALSTADIAAQVGTTVDGVRVAVRGLIKKGYLVNDHGNYYDFYEIPQGVIEKDAVKDVEESSAQIVEKVQDTAGKSIGCKASSEGEIIKENYMKSTLQYKEVLSKEEWVVWDEIFQRIRVKRYPHSMKRLKDAAGTEPDVHVIRRIVSQNWRAFEKGMEEQEGYRFNTLINLTSNQYTKWKNLITGEDAERRYAMEEARSRPKINYDNIYRKEPEQEGLGDISDLLDEMFGDFDDVG